VVTAFHGQEALELLECHGDTDVILLDLQMPVMNGYELLKRLKRDDRYRDIPVVVLTSDKNEVLTSLSMGANDFLSKPYHPQELKLRIQNHLRGKKLHDLSQTMSSVLEQEVVKKTAQLRKALENSRRAEFEISLRLGKAAEFRDAETGIPIMPRMNIGKKVTLKPATMSHQAFFASRSSKSLPVIFGNQ
jgi:putative two-component system response regulator